MERPDIERIRRHSALPVSNEVRHLCDYAQSLEARLASAERERGEAEGASSCQRCGGEGRLTPAGGRVTAERGARVTMPCSGCVRLASSVRPLCRCGGGFLPDVNGNPRCGECGAACKEVPDAD